PKRRALRPPDGRPGHRIDLFDRESFVCERLEGLHYAVEAETVGNEVGGVLRDHHAFAEAVTGELRDRCCDRRIRVRRRDDLEEAEITRRIEKVRAEPVPP